ncbi:MAG: VWA domain-containing protein [Clostridia bacterium]|nr:VWA domain-containing protein [Clostridia bacterium]
MSFAYPLGLLGLIGIPILIIIYIIKNKYTEQVISSTYLWTLSERFLKKRLPINKLIGIISLILQIIAVLFISLGIAQPILFIKNAAHDYCFILDGSGSMNIERSEGVTRFDTAKGEIASVINGSMKGSAYTLVFVGDTADRIFEDITDKDRALTLLNDVSVSYTVAGYTDAIGVAQNYFNENSSVITYLVTDKEFKNNENVKVINVSSQEENYAVYGGSADSGADDQYKLSCSIEGEKLEVSGYVMSYESDANLTVELYVDGAEEATDTQTVAAVKLEPAKFSFTVEQKTYQSVKVVIAEKDALPLDNEITVYNVEYENSFTTLLVSDEPTIFVRAALQSAGNAITTVVAAKDYKKDESAYVARGYDLYIYENCTPEALPRDSAVWLLNPTASVAGAGFALQDEVELGSGSIELKFNTSTSSTVKKLTEYMTRDDKGNSGISVAKKYQQCKLYNSFTTLLYAGGSPVVFAGANDYNNREVVFAYDVHWSNSALITDYVILFRNLLNFTFPNVVEDTLSYCGNTVEISVPANCQSIRVNTPSGNVNYLDSTSAVCELNLAEVGTYEITLSVGDNSRTYSIYSYLPSEESVPNEQSEISFSLEGEAGNGRRNGIYDDLLAIFILLALVFAADWMVYCYEQYQLR